MDNISIDKFGSASGKLESDQLQVAKLSIWLILATYHKLEFTIIICFVVIFFRIIKSGKIDTRGFKMTWPILLLCVLGLFGAIFSDDFEFRNYIRDFFYTIKVPFLVVATAIFIDRKTSTQTILSAILIAGFVVSLSYIARYQLWVDADTPRRLIQIQVGRGYLLAVYAIPLALFAARYDSGVLNHKLFRLLVAVITAYGIYLSTSRSLPLFLLFFGGIWLLYELKISFQPIFIIYIVFIALFSLPPVRDMTSEWLAASDYKFVLTNGNEIFAKNFDSLQSIREGFRSYEASKAWSEFQEFSTISQLFGKGFGHLTDLGVQISLGVTATEQEGLMAVPTTHISAMAALLKFGWFGFLLYFSSVIPFLYSKKVDKGDRILLILNNFSCVIIVYVIFLFQGLFSKLEILNTAVVIASMTTLHLQTQYRLKQKNKSV
ncbi:hypothetical protein [Cohaesibacter celericrescens]|uniref:O-antigen ligase domain-containing protein n=1 Tax=Cohaesibacter celericrescens TaxID=2067669 RepID=A0A2N5XK25_9HYPH|nr:hypothetical protein [Cohaesibacter celericrescens]PLW74852.1 hypothetical protein C0081_21255 [Cohaesibacter celericrescens]